MRLPVLILAALAAFLPPLAAAQSETRPLDRIYGPPAGAPAAPRAPGTARPAGPLTGAPAAHGTMSAPPSATGARPLDRIYGPGAGAPSRGLGLSGGAAAGSAGRGGLRATTTTRPGTGAVRKPAGPTYRGGSVGTRPRFSNSPSLGRPRR